MKNFRRKREGLKIPKRTRDAEYDGWCLVVGEPRPEFDLELFYSDILQPKDKLIESERTTKEAYLTNYKVTFSGRH